MGPRLNTPASDASWSRDGHIPNRFPEDGSHRNGRPIDRPWAHRDQFGGALELEVVVVGRTVDVVVGAVEVETDCVVGVVEGGSVEVVAVVGELLGVVVGTVVGGDASG
jgi:hypothetical protein